MQNDSLDSTLEPAEKNKTVESGNTWYPYNSTNSFGSSFKPPASSFEQQRFDQRPHNLPIRGGVQVLPPVVPPRSLNGSVNQPIATPRPKPKPPLPPKRDELTRLTTVRPTITNQPITEPVKPVTVPVTESVTAETRPVCSELLPKELSNNEGQTESLNNTSANLEPDPENTTDTSKFDTSDKTNPNLASLDLIKSDKDLGYDHLLDPESPSSEDGATADIWVRAIDSPIKKPFNNHTPYSNGSASRHSSTGDESDVKESKPVKKPERKGGKHRVVLDNSYLTFYQNQDDKQNKGEGEDNSIVQTSPVESVKEEIPVENNVQLTQSQSLSPNVYSEVSAIRNKNRVIGSESLPCSRPGSRATSRSSSPASFVSERPIGQSSTTKQSRISAAEALGVVAKPCPRPPSTKRSNNQEYRRQSLGNLSDSKLSVGYDRNCSISCTIRGLWSSIGDNYQESQEYRRERTHRGSSVDSRTLSRIKVDCGHSNWDPAEHVHQFLDRESHPISGYSTLSRITRSKGDSKYFARSTTPVQSGYSSADSSAKEDTISKKEAKTNKVEHTCRPKSTCNCGHHVASSGKVDTGKRTFSVEELTTAFARQCTDFSRASSSSGSARSSFGKSPRVTFALAEDTMGASGGAISKTSDSEQRVTGGAARKILRGKQHQTPQSDSADEGVDPRVGGLQHRQFQGGGAHGSQSNRSQPAIGLKQTPKSRPTIFGTVASDLTPKEGGNCRRSLPQTTLQGGVKNGAGVGRANVSGDQHDPLPEPSVDHDNALVYRDGNLVSGSLDALIQHMVPTSDYYPDRAYLFAFLLSSRLFIKPHELLGQVTALCDSQQKLSDKQASAKVSERLGRFIPRLVQLLAEWSETFPYDFRDERVMAHVRSITQGCVSVAGSGEANVRHEVSTLLQNLLHRLTALEKYEEFLQRINAEATTNNVEGLNTTDVTDVCGNASSIAQQLTHIELERLSYIGPEEFVQAFAKENPHLETSFKDMKKTRNLESYVSWFNRLSYLVATEVVKHVKKKQRVKVVEFWIETARECFNIGNFNSLMAIIAGLNMSPISRLKKTWSKVQSAKFSVLEHQMDPTSNFCNYRSTLKAAMWRSAGATDQSQRIVIPFFSLLVKDLYFLNEGCSNKLHNGHINFEKFWQLAKQVTEFITWKQVTCPFEKNSKVITFLQVSPVLTENALALASFECEPPDNNLEKERCKSLKAEMTL